MIAVNKLRWMALLIIISILFFSSYSFSAKDPANIQVYVEQTIGEGLLKNPGPIIRLSSKNQLVVYDSGCYNFITLDGKLARQIKADFNEDGHVFALDPHDNLYALAQDRNSAGAFCKLYVYSPAGEKLKTLDLGKSTAKNGLLDFIYDMAVDAKGVIYLAIYDKDLFVIGQGAKSMEEYRSGQFHSVTVDADGNLVVKGIKGNGGDRFLAKIRTTNGEVVWETKLDLGNWIYRLFYNPADKFIYGLGNKHIERYDSSGRFNGNVFDLFQNNLAGENLRVDSLAVDSSQNIYIVVPGSPKAVLKKYTPGKEAKPEKNQKVITIAVDRNIGFFLELAANAFRKNHPEWQVNIKEYVNSNTGWMEGIRNYQRTINTEIMAGKGADIIDVGVLPYKKYIDRNLLVDLSDPVDKDEDLKKKLDTVTFDSFKYKGKLFVIPRNISMYILYANKTILDREGIKIDDRKWAWRDFTEIAKKVTKDTDHDGIIDQYALPKMDESSLFYYIFKSSWNRFIDFGQKKAQFDAPEFYDLLKLCKSLKKFTNPQVDAEKFQGGAGRGSIIFFPAQLGKYESLVYTREQIFHDQLYVLSFPGANKGIYTMNSGLYVINNNSHFKNEAWELLQTMMTEELQNSGDNYGMPVNFAARKRWADIVMNRIDYLFGERVSQKLTKEEVKQVDELLSRGGLCPNDDLQLQMLVANEVSKFFTGEKTAEEISKIIQNKVNIYLNE